MYQMWQDPSVTPLVSPAVWVRNVPASLEIIRGNTVPGFAHMAVPITRHIGHGSAVTPTLFTLVEEDQHLGEHSSVKEKLLCKSASSEVLLQFPTDLIELVLSAPAKGAITCACQELLKKEKGQQDQFLRAEFCRKFAECALTYG